MNRLKQLITKNSDGTKDKEDTYKPMSNLFLDRLDYFSLATIGVYNLLLKYINMRRVLEDSPFPDKYGYMPTEVNPSIRTIEKTLHIGYAQVNESIQDLIDTGYVTVRRGNSEASNKYFLSEYVDDYNFLAGVEKMQKRAKERKLKNKDRAEKIGNKTRGVSDTKTGV